jgi:asparagine synthase (glutamine-hydrolysing)
MCAICGLVEPRTPERDARVLAMRAALRHRGPDDEGHWSDDHAALGHARLAIIDLSAGARQPMASDDGRFVLVFNGEIYNYRELRKRLGGRPFRTQSDSEVILRAYEEWREGCVHELDGMFAFAIWDAKERSLFAARDRLGKKPFAYRRDGARFAFASEIHALGGRDVDPFALEPYLAYGYVPAPLSMVKGVEKLPAATWLRFADGRVTRDRYWSPAPSLPSIREPIERAVERRLVADVPVGAFLSGGIDSSIIVGLMSRHRRVQTFTVGFDDPEFDEREPARAVAERFGTDHHEFVVKVDAMGVLPELVRHFGEPFGDPSAVPTYYVARETRRHVKVALSGDGGDECFGGYRRHLAVRKLKTLKPVGWAVKMLASLYRPKKYGARARRVLAKIDAPLAELYRDLVTVFPDDLRKRLTRTDRDVSSYVEAFFTERADDPVAAAGYTDLMLYLPDDLLVKTDIASMASGLEVRCPFLDPEVVNAAFAIPGSEKIRGNRTKAALREAFRDLLPPSIARREKQGFGVPVDRWLRGPMREMLRDHLLDRTARERNVFEPAVVEELVREHEAGADHGQRLWLLLIFEVWARQQAQSLIDDR